MNGHDHPSWHPSWAERAYTWLMRAYPRHFRSRFAPAMRETFVRDHARVRESGVLRLITFWIVTIAQALWFGGCERLSPSRRRSVDHTARTSLSMIGDGRHAFRLLAKSPPFALTAILSLAIGLAAATAIFALADTLLFQASPGVRNAARVVDIVRTTNGAGYGTLSHPLFRHLRDHTQTIESMAATTMDPVPLSLSGEGGAEWVSGRTVSATFFDALGVRPALGRFFRPDEDQVPDARPVAVLSHRFWQTRFGSDPGVLDRAVRLNDTRFTIVGVAEAGFENTTMIGTDLWVPMAMAGVTRGESTAALLADSRSTWHMAIGRLAPGVSREAAEAELNTLLDIYRAETPSIPAAHGIAAVPSGRVPPPVRQAFAMFVGLLFALAVGLLAIACSNVAGMLLARATTRHHEMAIRLALGASRSRLIRQLLIETIVLFGVAAVAAVPVTIWLADMLQAFLPALPVPIQIELSITLRSALFAALLALATGVLFGLTPARHALGNAVSPMLHGRSVTASRRRLRLRQTLVVGQVALALTLVITAGLFVRTLQAASTINPGFETANVAIVSIDTTLAGATGSRAIALLDRVVERVRTIGGVEAVGHARMVPLQGGSFALGGVRLGAAADAVQLDVEGWDVVSPDYFSTLSLPIVQGRAFTSEDRDGRPLVAMVNEAFARAAWPGQAAVGQRFWQITGRQREGRAIEVIGVARDARFRSIGETPRPFVHVPYAQHPQTRVELFVRHARGQNVATDVRAAIAAVDPGLPVVMIQSFADAIALGLLPQRVAAWLAGIAGSIGIFLAALGLYGLTTFLVVQRTREMAIRMALGASGRDIGSMVLSEAARLGALGTAMGLVLALAMGQVIRSSGLLIGIASSDPLAFGGMAFLLGTVLLAASYLPARRATATDPAASLRAE